MNILINTPLLKTNSLKTDFDNKILIIFLVLISVLIVLGILFFDLVNAFSNSNLKEEDSSDSPAVSIYT